MIDNEKSNISKGGSKTILLRNARKGVESCATKRYRKWGGSGKRKIWHYITGE